jgi:pimeloyl-ACP methyl ester carboxylesterase
MAPPSRERIVLLFCHGGSFHKEIWTPIVRRLQASALLQRVPCDSVAIDWRYHGAKSTDVDAATLYYEGGDKKAPRVEHPGRHWPEWAPPDLRKTIEELRREDKTLNRTTRIVGIGHSMGAATLLNVEVHQPGTFSGLVLFEPPFAVGERPEVLSKAASVMVLNTMGRPEEWYYAFGCVLLWLVGF